MSGRIDTMKRTVTVTLVGGPLDDTEVEVNPRKVFSGGMLVFARVHNDFTSVYGPNRMAIEAPLVYDTYVVKRESADDERLYGYFAEWADPTPPDFGTSD